MSFIQAPPSGPSVQSDRRRTFFNIIRGIWIAQIFFDKSHSDHGGRSPPYISLSYFEGSVGWAVPTDFMKMALESMFIRGVRNENARAGLKPDTRNLKPMLGERFTMPDNVQKKSYFLRKLTGLYGKSIT